MSTNDVSIIGGGLSGLIAAATLADKGLSVDLFERGEALGGRARTTEVGGALLNLGPHALYKKGALSRSLRRLGVRVRGRMPRARGALAFDERGLSPFLPLSRPGLLPSLLSFMFGHDSDRRSIAERIEELGPEALLRGRAAALLRVSTYCDDAAALPANMALAQMKLGLVGGVQYLDGGWQTMVDGLRDRALALGVRMHQDTRVEAVEPSASGPIIRLSGGGSIRSSQAILAVSPSDALRLCPSSAALAEAKAQAKPLTASVLDVALDALPRPDHSFALGTERPLYYSLHSRTAALGAGRHVIHLAGYGPGAPVSAEELERFLDVLQPGWRAHLCARRYLPSIAVTHDYPRLGHRRASGQVADVPGLFVAGDWVGPHGMLSDAAAESAEAAAAAITSSARRAA